MGCIEGIVIKRKSIYKNSVKPVTNAEMFKTDAKKKCLNVKQNSPV